MRYTIIIALVLLVLALVGYGVTQSRNNNSSDNSYMIEESDFQDSMEKDGMVEKDEISDDTTMENDHAMDDDKGMVKEGGKYLDYDENLLIDANDLKIVLFFHANWCPTCKALDKNIRENISNIPDDTIILKVDYDKASELKKKYSIVIQHTLVQVDQDGDEITKWTGGNDINSITKRIK